MEKIVITAKDAKNRLDHFLGKDTEESRSSLQKKIKSGDILVNEKIVKSGYILEVDDVILIKETIPVELNLDPVKLNLDIVYDDSDVVVINKPKGLVVHPAETFKGPTLVHGLLAQIEGLSGINGVIRPGIVHRIDKDTSGLLLVAKNDTSHKILAAELAKHEIKRKYFALVYGRLNHKLGTIDAPIGRHAKNRIKYAVAANGKKAITHFKLIQQFKDFALIECSLETGRTHQIRVHLAYINHPIVGDQIYGPLKVIGNQGQFLHAYSLEFIQPTTKKQISIQTDLPKYFSDFLTTLS